MKSKLKKRRLYPLLGFFLFGLLNILNLSSGIAIHMQGGSLTFNPDDDYPIQYGVFKPAPNMFVTMSIQGSNQGEFTMMNWFGGAIDTIPVPYPGQDISHLYPLYFNDYISETPTNNNFTDPWSTNWVNITAFNPHNVNLSQYTLNSVYNYYMMREESLLNIQLNSSIPIQIDILISGTGPKILKVDWLTDNPAINLIDDLALISPSGKLLEWDMGLARYEVVMVTSALFRYLTFIAHETGTYRLLINAPHTEQAHMILEFINTPISTLSLNILKQDGNSDDDPTGQDGWEIEWQNRWYKISGEVGDLFKLDIGIDYFGTVLPKINLWMPCEKGYARDQLPGAGIYDIIFGMSGDAYISFIDETIDWWYRYSLFLSETKTVDYTIGDDITTFKVSGGERKTIKFEVDEDSFIRFNYTFPSPPLGDPSIYAPGVPTVPFGFIFEDSKKLEGFDTISYVDLKTIESEDFYYYFLPNGTYMAFIANNDVRYDGIIQISSKIIDFSGLTIPQNSLTYDNPSPSQVLTVEFEPDDFYDELYEAKYVDFEITEPGQYILNTIFNASDYIDLSSELYQVAAVVYNSTGGGTYHDFTDEALNTSKSFPAFSDDGGNENGDILYIGCSQKYELIEFNFSTYGAVGGGGGDIDGYTWNGSSWIFDSLFNDGTSLFTSNGTITLDSQSIFFRNWTKGADFDLLGINESFYYWIGIENDGGNYNPLPYIQNFAYSNISIVIQNLNINLAVVGDSGYEYCDFWKPTITPQPGFVFDVDNLYVSADTNIFKTGNPYIIGFEEGLYKLLIIPEGELNYNGPITITFALKNQWSYRHQETYNIPAISPIPNLYQYQIRNYTDYGYSQDNVTFYNYGLTTSYNDTESIPTDLGSNSYFVLESFGDAYQWTQLVVSADNVTDYDLFIMQDLPWIDNSGPNNEVMKIPTTTVNTTYEFGVLTNHFYLIFEVDAFNDTVTFRIDLNQYNTTALYSNEITASYTPASNGDILVLTLAIVIPTIAGAAVVVVYVLKKKGRILTKTPSR